MTKNSALWSQSNEYKHVYQVHFKRTRVRMDKCSQLLQMIKNPVAVIREQPQNMCSNIYKNHLEQCQLIEEGIPDGEG